MGLLTLCMLLAHAAQVGFNNGADTAFFLSQGYKVVGVDANPGKFAPVQRKSL